MTLATVVEVIDNQQGYRGVEEVRCRIIEGNQEGKILVRKARGPVREQDVVHLAETEME
jgi:small subunit ribosomal protein S28e